MRLLRLLYLMAQHPFHLHRWLVQRGLYQGWIKDFIPFWNSVRPPSLPISDYASFTWLEYFFTQRARERNPEGDHFEDKDWQYARLLSYVKRREMHPLRMLFAAWHLRKCYRVLEFGAGAAPYAHFIKTAWPMRQEVWVSDCIESAMLFRYARRGQTEWVGAEQALNCKWDGILCTEVFEHLPDPVKTAEEMMRAAKIIAFDYVDDGTDARRLTLEAFRSYGRGLSGPDKRGLYLWSAV